MVSRVLPPTNVQNIVYEIRGSSEVWAYNRHEWAAGNVSPAVWWFVSFATSDWAKSQRTGEPIRVYQGRHWSTITTPGWMVINSWNHMAWFENQDIAEEYLVSYALHAMGDAHV